MSNRWQYGCVWIEHHICIFICRVLKPYPMYKFWDESSCREIIRAFWVMVSAYFLFYQIKHKYAWRMDIIAWDDMWCDKYRALCNFLLDSIFFVLLDKTKIGKLRTDGGITCQNISAQKLIFFRCILYETIMLFFFTHYSIN